MQGMVQRRSVPLVQLFKLLAPDVVQTGTLVRAHERPLRVLLDAAHEQVGYPQSIEKIAGSLFFFARVLPAIQEIEHVGVPRFEVDGKSTGSLKRTQVIREIIKKHRDKGLNYEASARAGNGARTHSDIILLTMQD